MPNIEMKTRFKDLAQARETALRLGGKLLWKDTQIDTYFTTRAGKLKLRESGLNGAELIPYLKTDAAGLKRSDYARIPVNDPVLVKTLFTQLLGQRLEVRKNREVYILGNVRVHLDEVAGLGNFMEFEAVIEKDTRQVQEEEKEKVLRLMKEFGIEDADLLEGSYPDLLAGA